MRIHYINKTKEKEAEQIAAGMSLEKLPTIALLQAMEMLLNIINKRGTEVRDWDNKDKTVHQIRMIGAQPYFLCTKSSNEIEQFNSDVVKLQTKVQQLLKENARLRSANGGKNGNGNNG
ncbi:MAG: hypothetical protein ACLT3H_02710 [Roseburia sp.]